MKKGQPIADSSTVDARSIPLLPAQKQGPVTSRHGMRPARPEEDEVAKAQSAEGSARAGSDPNGPWVEASESPGPAVVSQGESTQRSQDEEKGTELGDSDRQTPLANAPWPDGDSFVADIATNAVEPARWQMAQNQTGAPDAAAASQDAVEQEVVAAAPVVAAQAAAQALALAGLVLVPASVTETGAVVASISEGTVLAGQFMAGPVVAGNGLSVKVYDLSGKELGSGKIQDDGFYRVPIGNYTGGIVAKVLDTDGQPDFMDEATGKPKDLNAVFMAVENITEAAGTQVTVHLNALTTVAAVKAGLNASDGSGTIAGSTDADKLLAIANANAAVAKVAGVSSGSITQQKVIATVNADGSPNATANAMGKLLAAVSGIDDAKGGDMAQAIQALVTGIIGEGSKATLKAEAASALIDGAAKSKVPASEISSIIPAPDTQAPLFIGGGAASASFAENASGVAYTSQATDNVAMAGFEFGGGADDAKFNLDAATGALSFKSSPDFERPGSAAQSNLFTVKIRAKDVAGNSAMQTVTVSVADLNDNPPVFTSGATGTVVENAPTSTAIYTAATSDADGSVANKAVSYSLKPGVGDVALLDINASTGVVTLKASADYESSKKSYGFTVVATNAGTGATLSAEQAVTVSVNDLNDNAPVFTSGATGSVDENAPITTAIYSAASTDADGTANNRNVVYSLKDGGDKALLNISNTGVVTLKASADYETKSSYSFTVVATNGSLVTERAVTVSVNDLNDNAPVFTSGATGSVDENAAISIAIYTPATTDADGTANNRNLVYSLKANTGDVALLTISNTGVVTLKASADYETKSSYSFTVVATNGSLVTERAVTVSVNDLNDNAPVFTSGATASVDENAAISTAIYTPATTDADGTAANRNLVYSLKDGGDKALLDISSTGVVTLKASADYETKSSYSFTVVATNGSLVTERAVTVSVTDLNDNAPVFTSGATGSVDENAPIATAIYSAASTDADGTANNRNVVYSLKDGGDKALLNISNTGVVTLKTSADYETKSSYSFTVVATNGSLVTEQAVSIKVNDVDEIAPEISGALDRTTLFKENSTTQVFRVGASDNVSVTAYELAGGADDAKFNINPTTGVITFKAPPDFERPSSAENINTYEVKARAKDAAGNLSDILRLRVTVLDVDDTAPVFKNGAEVSVSFAENSLDVVYLPEATDVNTTASGVKVSRYSFGGGADDAKFDIDASTGALRFKQPPDFENPGSAAQSNSYTVIIKALDEANNVSNQTVTVKVTDVQDALFADGPSKAVSFIENSTSPVYTVRVTDPAVIGFEFAGGADDGKFNLDPRTGALSFKNPPDFEAPGSAAQSNSYVVLVRALGASAGDNTQSLTVNVQNVDETFSIALDYSGQDNYRPYFDYIERAARRWESIITADLPDVGDVDDIKLSVAFLEQDGPGKVLANADYTARRADGAGLPYLGAMAFDIADLPTDEASAKEFFDTTLHEMGHALGFGGELLDQLKDEQGNYIGSNALREYRALLEDETVSFIPLENFGASGTVGMHWSEGVFGAELMTGFSNPDEPLSRMTVGAMQDFGYTVDYAKAAAYSLLIPVGVTENQVPGTAAFQTRKVINPAKFNLIGRSLSGPDADLFTVDDQGRVFFKASPDFENPLDAGKDNIYRVAVNTRASAVDSSASDPSLSKQETVFVEQLKITVGDLNEAPLRASSALPELSPVNEDSANSDAVSLGLSGLAYAGGAGAEADQALSYAITAIPSFITLYKSDGTAVTTSSTGLTLADLQGLQYKTVADANGTGNISWTVTDDGASGGANVNSLSQSLSITINAVNDAPTLSGTASAKTFTEVNGADTGANKVRINDSLVVADVDNTTLSFATVVITNVQSGDVLALPANSKFSASYDASKGELRIAAASGQSQSPTLNDFQDALRSVTFNNTSDTPNTSARTIGFSVNDGSLSSSPVFEETVNVVAVTDRPALLLGDQSAPLVEAGGTANGTPGNPNATIALTVQASGIDFDDLLANGWNQTDGGASYTKSGTYGDVTLTVSTGLLAYVLDNSRTATQALTGSQTVNDVFRIQVTDGATTAFANASFQIQGADDESTQLDGSFTAGPAIAGNGLTVKVYDLAGKLLGSSKVADNGSYSVNIGSYIGGIVAKVEDSTDAPDFWDEATGQAKDLNAVFMAVEVIAPSAGKPLAFNLNPLTTVAVAKLGFDPANGTGSIEGASLQDKLDAIDVANKTVARFAKIAGESITRQAVVPTVKADGTANSAVNELGKVLAAISGADKTNGGDMALAIRSLASGIVGSASVADLTRDARTVLSGGAVEVQSQIGDFLDTFLPAADVRAPVFTEGADAPSVAFSENGKGVAYRPKVTDNVALGRFELSGGADAGKFNIDVKTGALSFKVAPDFEAPADADGKNDYVVNITAYDAAGNFATQAVMVSVTDLVTPTSAQAFALWQEAEQAAKRIPGKDINAFNQYSPEIMVQKDSTSSDGSSNQPDSAKRLSQWINQVTGTDIVSAQEYSAGFRITGKAASGARSTVQFRLDKDRTTGNDGDGAQVFGVNNAPTGVTVTYDDNTGDWSLTFAANSGLLKPATHNTYGSGVHQLVVDTDGSGSKGAGEASRLFLVADGTASSADTGTAAQNYSVQDKITGDVFVYYHGDPDGAGVGLSTLLDYRIPTANLGTDTAAVPGAVLLDRDGSGRGDDDYYSTIAAYQARPAVTEQNTALRFVTDIRAQVWEFHVATNTNSTEVFDAVKAKAADHSQWGSNTSRMASLQEAVALYAANFIQGTDGNGDPRSTVGAVQPISSLSSLGVAQSGVNYDNTPLDWPGLFFSAAPTPTGHALLNINTGLIEDFRDSLKTSVVAVL